MSGLVTQEMRADFDRCMRLAREAGLTDLREGTAYGTPAIRTARKAFLRIKEGMEHTAVLLLPVGAKALLLQVDPQIYFETKHYYGWPAILIRLDRIPDEELSLRIVQSWRDNVSLRHVREYDARREAPQAGA